MNLARYKWVIHDTVLSVCSLLVESKFSKLILRSHACQKDATFHSGKWHKDSLEQVFVQNIVIREDEYETQTKHHGSFQSCPQQTLMQKYRNTRIPHLDLPTSWYRFGRFQTWCEIFILLGRYTA
jgi:hypothetical protein